MKLCKTQAIFLHIKLGIQAYKQTNQKQKQMKVIARLCTRIPSDKQTPEKRKHRIHNKWKIDTQKKS